MPLGTSLADDEVYGQGMRTLTSFLAFAILAGAAGAVEPPTVTGVSPTPVVMSPKAQALKVAGTGFAAGLTVEVMSQGNTEVYSGTAIQGRTATTFDVNVVLAQAGEATLIVRNTDGGVSEPFPFKVEAGPAVPRRTVPAIDRVSPDKVTRGSVAQTLTLSGSNFVQGLSVSVTDPAGTVTVLKGTALESVTPETVKFSLVLDTAGEYSLLVTNPGGVSSNTVVVIVS